MIANLTEKAKEYRNIVILQSILILAALLLKDIFSMSGISVQSSQIMQKQLVSVITLMNVSANWRDFKRLFARKFGQQEIDFDEE